MLVFCESVAVTTVRLVNIKNWRSLLLKAKGSWQPKVGTLGCCRVNK